MTGPGGRLWSLRQRWTVWRMSRIRTWTWHPGERPLDDGEQGLLALAEFGWLDGDGTRRAAGDELAAEQEAAAAARGDEWWRA